MKIININLFLIVPFILFFLFSCKKNDLQELNNEEVISPITGTRYEKSIDSIYLYAKQIYLWNEALPPYNIFLPRTKYGDINSESAGLKKELYDITQLKINQQTGLAYEYFNSDRPKYSFLNFGRLYPSKGQAGTVINKPKISANLIQIDDENIAYLYINTFPNLTSIKTSLLDVFNQFSIKRPKFFILDLRDNSGGYVETAEYLSNLIVASKYNGKLMYTEVFNQTLQQGKATILRHQPYLDNDGKPVMYRGKPATMENIDYSEKANTYYFSKSGNLETITDIYIITSANTASASEMLISSLKPYYAVKLIGETTFGKPVGFFGINIDQYSVYLSSFLIKNANNWSDYFMGMSPDYSVNMPDNPAIGELTEPCLSNALTRINLSNSKSILNNKLIFKSLDVKAIVIKNNDGTQSANLLMTENRFKLKLK